MIYEAKYRIGLILEDVEKKAERKNDLVSLGKISDLRKKVNESMQKNDNLQKWDRFKSTTLFKSVYCDFDESLCANYPELLIAKSYYEKPSFFNED